MKDFALMKEFSSGTLEDNHCGATKGSTVVTSYLLCNERFHCYDIPYACNGAQNAQKCLCDQQMLHQGH